MDTFAEVMTWLKNHRPFGIKPGLQRVEHLLEALGNPERRLLSVHIGGTNGKGSTLTYVQSMLQASGLRVGTFTSPYIIQFEERISVNGTPIPQEDFISAARAVAPHAAALEKTEWGPPTEFEILTVIANWYFAKVAVPDIVIWEVGLGGRLDSTNVIQPTLSVITNVGKDHMHILGSEITDIAKEKAGIIKPAVPVITACRNPEASAIIHTRAVEMHAPYYAFQEHFELLDGSMDKDGGTFSVRTPFHRYKDLRVFLRGEHQLENGALAVMIADYLRVYRSFPIDKQSLAEGLAKAFWPGRLEKLQESPLVLMDGAHNPEGVERLARYLAKVYPDRALHLLTAFTVEKEPSAMFAPILSLDPASFIMTRFSHPRAADPAQVSLAGEAFSDWKKGYNELLKRAGANDVIVLAGSLYFISEVRRHFLAGKKV
ncbi:bifunctional folylpolyglutamate synthase/dihydrofolate synthase [Salicibibacter kimchii]|uniref:Dihydrofolate synthase/folylpolyglutamate synthase n=1 Tax=Salicibibacter kimchii TaxID=2099786 RepID=A0A345BXW0_9BACI|nr:folylpolyglutamate synthase/dihydrofolate synthase family protein [Salicibibacter kimchii]AXF55791.1 bifunctional folylpolyglutamate synthase/dihydrofolate synthase [Salicibibacter kimchii]